MIGGTCNSLPLIVAHRPPLFAASVSFNLPTTLALLIMAAAMAAVSAFSYFAFRGYRPKLRVALVLIRASYTLGLLLIVLDAAFVRSREEPARLLIVKSDSPMMRLQDAAEGKTRDEAADDISRILVKDAGLREQFSIEQVDCSPGDATAFEAGGAGAPPAAIVSLTDTSDASIAEAQHALNLTSAPMFVTPVRGEKGVPDVSVNSVDYAGTASLDAPLTIRAMLYGRGMAGRSTLVRLSDEALALSSTVAQWKEDSEAMAVPLVFTPRAEGLRRYSVRAETCDGEINGENNEISFSVDVRRAERRVLFIESQPSWEGKFIRRALEENRSIVIDYFAQVSRSAVLGQQQTEAPPTPQAVVGDFKKLASYDCVIMGPADNSSISDRAARNLTAFVERRGGGLVILGGNDFAGSVLSPSSPLNHLIPAQVAVRRHPDSRQDANAGNLETGSQSQIQGAGAPGHGRASGGATLEPTEEGRRVFWRAEGGKRIESLGPLSESYAQVKSLKAGAVALAVDGSRRRPAAPPLIVAQPYGYGRTLLFAPSDSWRIGLAESGDDKGAFALLWQSLILWAAEGAEPPSSVRLHPGAIESGDMVRAYLVARDDLFNPADQLSIRGAAEFGVAEKGGPAVKLPLAVTHDRNSPGVYDLSVPAAVGGDALLSVSVGLRDGGERSLSLPFFVQESRAAWRESLDSVERLQSAARAGGGELFKPDELELLKSRLAELRPVSQGVKEARHFRYSIALAFVLPALMSLEYLLRKRHSPV